MGFTYKEACCLIGTTGYTDVHGLRQLLQQTPAVPSEATPGSATLLYSGNVDDGPAWQRRDIGDPGDLCKQGVYLFHLRSVREYPNVLRR